ncbi:hypothetical protein PoB_006109400 [Plakobranchus ocellatus]|uniref:Uncharacterized protein n=1 Tax=Plakobranchus ocellatus TaxID=259542 RepID=A0AAV4CRX1_9GAST|nr:hypothetical protein PoB_006109400 [Plakobranchus ocellatus]
MLTETLRVDWYLRSGWKQLLVLPVLGKQRPVTSARTAQDPAHQSLSKSEVYYYLTSASVVYPHLTRLQQQHHGHKLSSPRDDTMSPSSSDRREHDNDIDEDDCISDLDSEISDPSHLEEIDPVSDGGHRRNSSSPTLSSSPPPNPLIVNNPFLPPHLQLPVRASSFELVRPPPPPPPPGMMLTPHSAVLPPASSSSASSVNSPALDGSGNDHSHNNNNNGNNNQNHPNHSKSPHSPTPLPPPNIPAPRPLFKPQELAASPDRSQQIPLLRPDHLGPPPLLHVSPGDQAPHQQRSPQGVEFIKRDPAPHPAFPAHQEMLNQFAAARVEFLHREAAISREIAMRERLGQGPGSIALHLPGGGVVGDFHPHHLARPTARVDFSKAHELARQEFASSMNNPAGKADPGHHDRFSPDAALPAFSRPNGVLGSAS